jgi:hypothetical protein
MASPQRERKFVNGQRSLIAAPTEARLYDPCRLKYLRLVPTLSAARGRDVKGLRARDDASNRCRLECVREQTAVTAVTIDGGRPVVGMGSVTYTEHSDELVLAPVE